MASQVLDLRKKQKKQNQEVKSKTVPTVKVQAAPNAQSNNPQISWEAPSFYYNPQKKYLSLVIIALATGGGAMFFFQRDTMTAIFMVLASLVLILYSNKRPEPSKITIDQTGVYVGENAYPYRELRSFWIHYDPERQKELSLESKKWYMPYVKVSIENKNPLTIRSLMVNFLPEKEHENSLVDIIARKIGL